MGSTNSTFFLFLTLVSFGCSSSQTPGPLAGVAVDGRVTLANLSAPVDVVRDKYGRPHIYASSINDAMRVEGYLVASDRTAQLDFLRRDAEGRLAEIFGSISKDTIDQDIASRQIGINRAAKQSYDALPADSEERQILDAYADGITQVFRELRSGDRLLPDGMFGLPITMFTDWTGADSLAILRLQSFLVSYDADGDILEQQFLEAARATFNTSTTDPVARTRVGLERDLWRFAPIVPSATVAQGQSSSPPSRRRPTGAKRPMTTSAMNGYLNAVRSWRGALAPEGFGSNGIVVSGKHTATGHAMLENDPHLGLNAPAIIWPVAFDVSGGKPAVPEWHVNGVALPGVPGILLGNNDKLAWGATVAGYDVSDAYSETLSADGTSVMFKGSPVPLQTIDEIINVGGDVPLDYKVLVVPQHGPILPTIVNHAVVPPDPTQPVVSIRWTGMTPSNDFEALLDLMRAGSIDEAKTALAQVSVGIQNWMLADTAGNIAWSAPGSVPVRDPRALAWNAATYTGLLPSMVLPGDGTAEWTGYLPASALPGESNPANGEIVTANNDTLGLTADNDPSNDKLPDGTPLYLHSDFDVGFRQNRLLELLAAQTKPIAMEDLQAIQSDVRSAIGSRLVPGVLTSMDHAEAERMNPGTHPDLTSSVADPAYPRLAAMRTLLTSWSTEGAYNAASGLDPDTNQPLSDQGTDANAISARASEATTIFNLWLIRLMHRTFGDELAHMGITVVKRAMLFRAIVYLMTADPTQFATTNGTDSTLWDNLDTPALETRDAQVIGALLDTVHDLDALGSAPAAQRWGTQHTTVLAPLIPIFTALGIPPMADPKFPTGFPRPGDQFAVDSTDFPMWVDPTMQPSMQNTFGPVQRLIVDLDPAGPHAWNAIAGGNVWDAASPHFQDEATYWREDRNHPVPFAVAEVIQAKESHTVFSATTK